MKKNFLLIIIFFLFTLLLPKVEAARVVCTNNNMSKMREKAYKVTANYEYVNEDGDRYFLIRIANVDKGIEVKADGHSFTNGTGEEQVFEFKKYSSEMTSIKIEMYAAYGYPCVGELIYSKKLDLPKYNFYSERSECIEYEEFPLCNKWYQGNIKDVEMFEDKLAEYIDSLKPAEGKKIQKENKNIFQKFIDFYFDHIVFTGILTIIVVVGPCYYIIKKLINRKNRVKIKF